MDVGVDRASRDSEEEFSKEFLLLADSGAGVIHVRTSEILRAVHCLRKTVLVDGGAYQEWDVVNGVRSFDLKNLSEEGMGGDNNIDLSSALMHPMTCLRDAPASEGLRCFVYVNPQPYMENNPHVSQLLLVYSEFLTPYRACVVLVTPDAPLPGSVHSGAILTAKLTPPGFNELKKIARGVVQSTEEAAEETNITEDDYARICHTGAGLTALQFETYLSVGAVNALAKGMTAVEPDYLMSYVQKGKTELVNASEILELYSPTNIGDVGGMENLKEWIRRRAMCYSDEAKEFGVEPPKGIVLAGVPGTGKSLVAKAVSGVLGVPLVRIDFGRVFSSYVGSSEQRMRGALEHIEAMSPIVVLADEIDKGLGGIASGGGSDSGVSMRVLGSFLTWLQDCTAPVFTIVTANNLDGLPPELLRRGRFDAIFSTTLPSPRERKEILEIHLRKRGRSISELSEEGIKRAVEASDRYVPAEIEAAVKDALVNAFSDGSALTADYIIDALKAMVPLSKTFAAKIEQMEAWAKNNATPVSLPEAAPSLKEAAQGNRSRISARRRK